MKIRRCDDFSGWYNELVYSSGLAEGSSVRGCVILKPYGYAVWECIRSILDEKIKLTGHQNAYFPLFIPKSYFTKEASHVSGFAKECAVITHHRLKENNGEIIVDEASKLEDEYIVRPTSETIIWSTYKKWIQSYRDIPLKINQWANVCRWEMRTRPFLRTSEFLWQEGHTAHATAQEAKEEAELMIDVYHDFGKDYLAIPFVKGVKSISERFAGADETYTVEALMQDGKAIQCGTSHILGQHFSKAFDVKYLDKNGEIKYVYGTSWGVSTRLIGALIMTHSDDNGLVLPPMIAPIQTVVIPIFDGEHDEDIEQYVGDIVHGLQQQGIRVSLDKRSEYRPGWKFNEYELRGVPLRIVAGYRDVWNNTIEVVRRDTSEKVSISYDTCIDTVKGLLCTIQHDLYHKAHRFVTEHTYEVEDYETFKKLISDKSGFVSAYYDGSIDAEERIKDETRATVRCIPLDKTGSSGKCILTGNTSSKRVLFAQSY